ncbi:hypothetical protein [Oceanobacillus oncorhynchi]|uniref:hypothetical protein n=1 Tax=Oceanobacillus oncorhynchi TaxID=545501 RepID=UPI0034D72A7C
MEQEVKESLIRKVHIVVGELANKDYLKANTNKQGRLYKKHVPYSLSQETEQAKEILDLLYKNEVTKEDEERIKGYLLLNNMYKITGQYDKK